MKRPSEDGIIPLLFVLVILTGCENNQNDATPDVNGKGNTGSVNERAHMDKMSKKGGMDGMDHTENMAGMDQSTNIVTDINVPRTSAQGLYRASIESELDPIVINRMHSWRLHLETADGEPVDDARITIRGGMPAHEHDLPTAPRVTRRLGNGDYLVEGMQFQMTGHWQVTFVIADGDQTDSVTFNFALE